MLWKTALAVVSCLVLSSCQTAASINPTVTSAVVVQPTASPTGVASGTATPSTTPAAAITPLPTIPSTSTPSAQATSRPSATETIPNVPDNVVLAARAALAQRLNTDPASIRLVGTEKVDWPDGSLGCPKLGVMYIQVVTPGYKLVLLSGSRTYEYHTDLAGHVVSCD